MNTHDHHDDESLPGEDELKALYRSLPDKEPAPALDQAVRRTAVDALRPARRAARWPVAMASAAVLVLAAGLSWRLYQPSSNAPKAPASGATAISAAPSAPTAPAADSVAPAAAPLAEQAAAPAPRMASHPPPAGESIRSALKARVIAPTLAAKPMAAPPAAEGAPSPSAPAPLAAAPAFAPMAATPMRDPTSANPSDSPAQELDKIRQLFSLQRREEALQRLAAFRLAHPDVPLPDDPQHQPSAHE